MVPKQSKPTRIVFEALRVLVYQSSSRLSVAQRAYQLQRKELMVHGGDPCGKKPCVCNGSCEESARKTMEFSVVADIPNLSWAAYSAQ